MKNILLTGMSGTGKSTVIAALSARGYRAIDTDTDEWSEWVIDDTGTPDWVWREDRIAELLSSARNEPLFLSGCKTNQGKFYPLLAQVILLSAPVDVLMERLATRTTNPYGKDPEELARIMEHVETIEPLLRQTSTAEIDASQPLNDVIEEVLRLIR